jgi:hypothetical protein
MTASDDQYTSRNSLNRSQRGPRCNAAAANDDLIVNATVTYAPLPVWKDFHWTCTVTNFGRLMQDRLE